jgi:hypothetical protein
MAEYNDVASIPSTDAVMGGKEMGCLAQPEART